MSNRKAVAETTAQILTDNGLTMNEFTLNKNKFQYHCSFCACELSNDSVRFGGVGACPACDDLAHFWVDSLRDHAANYFSNWEGINND